MRLVGDAGDGETVELRFGEQLDTRVLTGDGAELSAGKVAVAKYSCKSSHEQITGRDDEPDGWRDKGVPEHLVQMAAAALRLSERDGLRRIAAWVHMLGSRGHFVTKSRGYSTTLGALRDARAARAEQDEPADAEDDADEDSTLVVAAWEYVGSGYLNPATRSWRRASKPRSAPDVRRFWMRAASRSVCSSPHRDNSMFSRDAAKRWVSRSVRSLPISDNSMFS